MQRPGSVWGCLLAPKPSFGVSLPSPLSLHSQSEKLREALEGLGGETANPVVGEISGKAHTHNHSKLATWYHTDQLVRQTQGWLGLVWEAE